MISVEITNFKSLKHIQFEFEGFSTIVGRNFLGKSNILQAINAALTNQSGNDFITWGEHFCEVHIIMEGLDLLWHKEQGNNFYIIKTGDKEETYKKIGKDDIPKVLRDLGFGVMKLDEDSKLNLLYARQFDELFLVDKKDSKTLDLLTAVYGLDRLYKSIELCNKDQTSNAGMVRVRKKDLEVLDEDMKRFSKFEDVLTKRDEIKSEKIKIETEDKYVSALKVLYNDTILISEEVQKLKGIDKVQLPDISEIDPLAKELEKLEGLRRDLIAINSEAKHLKPIEGISIPQEDAAVLVLIDKIKELKKLSEDYIFSKKEEESLVRIEAVVIPECPKINFGELDTLRILYTEAMEIKTDVKVLTDSIKATDDNISSIIKTLEKEFKGICPLCGNELKEAA